LTDFQLLGKHASQSCNSCHLKDDGIHRKIVFASVDKNCESCHKDIHAGQFSAEGINDCTRCHTFENWKPVNFDHNKTRFSLTGAHSKLECINCHKTFEKNGLRFINYKLADFKCAFCHTSY
jgi:hypothetical protein